MSTVNETDQFAALEIKRVSSAERVADALRAMILRGDLEPGQPLREVALAASVGVSRNTIREAIRLLGAEGIVTHQIHRGALVTRLEEDDIADIFRVRRTLELAALRATISASPQQLSGLADAVGRIEEAVEVADLLAVIAADQLFHERLIEMLGSRRLSKFFETIQTEILLCLSIVDRSHADPGALAAEHRELLALITAGELERCAEVMSGHLAQSEETLKGVVTEGRDRAGIRPVPPTPSKLLTKED
jgi:DNA-binding GntR family transcriptional regulator